MEQPKLMGSRADTKTGSGDSSCVSNELSSVSILKDSPGGRIAEWR